MEPVLSSLRAGREALARGVTPLGKGAPLPARRAWRSTASRPAEHDNITWKEYQRLQHNIMGFKCGIVGLPNVGKSTLFNALTNAGISAENYPFCTIEPNVGVVPVPDTRLQAIAVIVKPERLVPAHVEFVDIAGLVAGASRGEGLGNKFLGHIRETHAIALVLRCFEDDNIVHVNGKVDPLADLDVINTELCLADLETLQRSSQQADKAANTGDKQAQKRGRILAALAARINTGLAARTLPPGSAERGLARELGLLTEKPVLYIANVEETGVSSNKWLAQLEPRARADGAYLLAISAAIEDEIAELDEDSRREFLRELDLPEPGLHRVIRAGYELLDLHTFFTMTPREVRAWTIRKGTDGPRAAGVIHTDFEKGFIRAEVIAYDDFIEHQGEQGAKNAGKWRLEGRDYTVMDGDVVLFRFNV